MEIGEALAVGAWNERWHSIVVGMLAKRGWQLVQDENAFAEAIYLEVQSRSLEGAEQQRVAIERATIRHYCIILHAACSDRASQRQRRAFEELWHYLYPIAFYRTQDAELAQDLAQQALVKVWSKFSQCREPGSFLSWTTLIVINEIREYYRSKGRRAEAFEGKNSSEPEMTESDMGRSGSPEEESEFDLQRSATDPGFELIMTDETREELLAIIRECVLNPQQQIILIESFFDDKGYKEIAEELAITVGNVHVLRHRALIALRKCEAFIHFVEDQLQ